MQSTIQRLNNFNARFIANIILGAYFGDNAPRVSGSGAGKTIDLASALSNSIEDIVGITIDTVKNSNGQTVSRRLKNKELRLGNEELERYVRYLYEKQKGRCAISGLQLQCRGLHTDAEMLCSLDRIDSDGHYERDNLQLVCRFINRWKSSSNDQNFRRLLIILREAGGRPQEGTGAS